MKICHFADVHYDEKNHDEIKKCMEFMIGVAEKEKPKCFICSGDITNSQYLGADTKSAKTIIDQFRQMSDIAPVAIVTGTFSHDGLVPELLKNISGKYPIHVSITAEQIYLVQYAGLDGGSWITNPRDCLDGDCSLLVVSQAPPPKKEHWKHRQGAEKDNFNIAEAMGSIFAKFGSDANEFFPDTPHILNGHFSLKGSKISETQLLPGGEISIDPTTLSMANADLYCLGHIHFAQKYDLPNGQRAFHSGSIFRKDFGERSEDKGFYIHNIIDNAAPSEFVKTPTRELIQLDCDCIKMPIFLNDIELDFAEVVLSGIEVVGIPKDAWVKVVITAWIDDIRMINQAKVKRLLLKAGASNVTIEIERVRRENSREDEIIKAVSLPDKVKALANHRCQPAPDGVMEMLEKVETLSPEDLINYSKERIDNG